MIQAELTETLDWSRTQLHGCKSRNVTTHLGGTHVGQRQLGLATDAILDKSIRIIIESDSEPRLV